MQFLSLESNLHIPVAGAIVRLMGGIGLPAKLDGWRPVLKRIKQGLDEGQMLQIYPEGELIDGCRTLRAFQPGAFQITCWFRKPMIPCLLPEPVYRGAVKGTRLSGKASYYIERRIG